MFVVTFTTFIRYANFLRQHFTCDRTPSITLFNISENCITLTMCLLFLKKIRTMHIQDSFLYLDILAINLITLTSYHRIIKTFPRIFPRPPNSYYYLIDVITLTYNDVITLTSYHRIIMKKYVFPRTFSISSVSSYHEKIYLPQDSFLDLAILTIT